MTGGRRWVVSDRYGNDVYLTTERWEHITDTVATRRCRPTMTI